MNSTDSGTAASAPKNTALVQRAACRRTCSCGSKRARTNSPPDSDTAITAATPTHRVNGLRKRSVPPA